MIAANTGTTNTISLGAGTAASFSYDTFTFAKSDDDLIFNLDSQNSLTFRDWYVSPSNRHALNLQVIAQTMDAFTEASADPLLDTRVELFDFRVLADRFDLARSADPTITQWALTDSLLDAHLAGSDADAIGGDLATYYGVHGTFDAASFNISTYLTHPLFGAIQPLTDQSGFPPLSI